MGLGNVENVDPNVPLAKAVETAFERVRAADASQCALLFDNRWVPTTDLVDIVASQLEESPDVQTLTLVHPSAAMTFIASAIGSRSRDVEVRAWRSVYDEPDDEVTDATASKTMFAMHDGEALPAFVRRAVGEARSRIVRRFALVFHAKSVPSMALADLLAEELFQTGVKEVGLVHPTAPLDTVVAALRLRLPGVRVSFASKPKRR